MKVENALYPTVEGLQALSRDTSSAKIAMLNLLKFREKRCTRRRADESPSRSIPALRRAMTQLSSARRPHLRSRAGSQVGDRSGRGIVDVAAYGVPRARPSAGIVTLPKSGDRRAIGEAGSRLTAE